MMDALSQLDRYQDVRKAQALEEAVRRQPRVELHAVAFHSKLKWDWPEPFDTCQDCQKRIANIRAEYARIVEEQELIGVGEPGLK